MKRCWVIALLFVIVLSLSATVSQAVPILDVGSVTVNAGDTFSVVVSITDAVDLTNWQFDLSYNASLLQANSVTEGAFLATGGATLFIPGFIDNTAGLTSGVSNSLLAFPGVSGSGDLALINFTALASGTTELTFANTFLNFLDSGGGINFTVTNGSVAVAAAPEPNSLMLLSLAGALLYGMRRWSGHGAENI